MPAVRKNVHVAIRILACSLLLNLFLELQCLYCTEAQRVTRVPHETGFCNKYIRNLQYNCDEYSGTTEDGYLLNIQRIGNSTATAAPARGGTNRSATAKWPVAIDHAVFYGADVWFFSASQNDAKNKLPFLLADKGYDVWMLNHRGTFYSPKHVSYNRTQRQFWDYSFDEMAWFDIPVFVSLIQRVTGLSKIHFIGYDQGAVIPVAAASTQSAFVDSLASAVLIGPLVYLGNVKSPVLQRWAFNTTPDTAEYVLGVGAGLFNLTLFNSLSGFLSAFGVTLGGQLTDGGSTRDTLNNITGPNCCISDGYLNVLGDMDPNWVVSPYRNLLHYQQEIRNGLFQRWNAPTPFQNTALYGGTQPPLYDPTVISSSVKFLLVSGGNDYMAVPEDVNQLFSSLHSTPSQLVLPNYAHMDLIGSSTGTQDVFSPIINFLEGV